MDDKKSVGLLTNLVKSVGAGMAIGIGAVIFLSTENKVAGAILFSVGLFLVCSFGLFLFTGKIGYVLSNRNKPNCAVIWFGNLLGSLLISAPVRFARPELHETALKMVGAKLEKNLLAVLFLAFFCGVLMYAAVENFRRHPGEVSGVFGVVMCVTAFILCGFEHSIADMSYCIFAVDSAATAGKSLLFLLVVTVGNSLGALALRGITEFGAQKLREKNK